MNKLALNIALVGVLSFATLSVNAAATAYNFTDLGDLGSGFGSKANGINNTGQVVGVSYAIDGSSHATLWNGAIATELAPLSGSFNTVASSINNSGQVAGWSSGHAILWNGNSVTDLGSGTANAINDSSQVAGLSYPPLAATLWNGTTSTELGQMTFGSVRGINNTGQVVGSNNDNATLWNGTSATNLGTLGGIRSEAYDINNAGQVVGWSFNGASSGGGLAYNPGMVPRPTIWNNGVATDLGTLGGAIGTAFAINDAGLAVGYSYTSAIGDGNHATLWNGSTITDLNSFLDASAVKAGWFLYEATGINENGWIVGNATNSLGISHAFMLAPVPEAETYSMLIVGLGLMSFMVRRRKFKQKI